MVSCKPCSSQPKLGGTIHSKSIGHEVCGGRVAVAKRCWWLSTSHVLCKSTDEYLRDEIFTIGEVGSCTVVCLYEVHAVFDGEQVPGPGVV